MRRGLLAGAAGIVTIVTSLFASVARADDGGTAIDASSSTVDAACPAPDEAGACPGGVVTSYEGGCSSSPAGYAPGGAGGLALLFGAAAIVRRRRRDPRTFAPSQKARVAEGESTV